VTCAAVVLLEDRVAADRCPYCGTFLESKPEAARDMIAPEGLLPFAVEQRKANAAFARWIAGLWFAPNALKKLADLGRLHGTYVPFWTFDSMTYSYYTGERGDNYWETEYYTETNAQGQTETKSRQVMKTRWTPVSGEVSHFFDDVLICASTSLPDRHVRVMTPDDLQGLEGFRPEYLSGFTTERYKIGPKEGFDKAKEVMDGQIRQLCCRDIGGDHQRVHTVSTQHVGVTFKHVLLPVWLASYRYKEQSYRVVVNGRTGAVVGDRPYSWVKIAALVLAILAVIALIAALFFAFSQQAQGAAALTGPAAPTASQDGGAVPARDGPRRPCGCAAAGDYRRTAFRPAEGPVRRAARAASAPHPGRPVLRVAQR
jgi:hypothetical protein